MASASLSSVPHSLQTSEISVPSDPLVDRVLNYLISEHSALLCDHCSALLRLQAARLVDCLATQNDFELEAH